MTALSKRIVEAKIGNDAFENLGQDKCMKNLLNSPGNFTASKLKWVKDNEPDIYNKIHKYMLPGDFIAYKLTGEINTTRNGLSEGMIWDYKNNSTADWLLDYYGIDTPVKENLLAANPPLNVLQKHYNPHQQNSNEDVLHLY